MNLPVTQIIGNKGLQNWCRVPSCTFLLLLLSMNHLEVIFRLWKQHITIGYLLLHKCLQFFFYFVHPKESEQRRLCRLDYCTSKWGAQSHTCHPQPQSPILGFFCFLETEQSVCGAFCWLIKGDLNWHVRGRDDIYINSIKVHQAWFIFLHLTASHFHCTHSAIYEGSSMNSPTVWRCIITSLHLAELSHFLTKYSTVLQNNLFPFFSVISGVWKSIQYWGSDSRHRRNTAVTTLLVILYNSMWANFSSQLQHIRRNQQDRCNEPIRTGAEAACCHG